MLCDVAQNLGFFSGLWAGLVAVFSLLADLFFDVTVYERCQNSWGYDLGYILGLLILGGLMFRLSWLFLIILLVAWFVSFVVANILVILILLAIVWALAWLFESRRYR